MHIPVLLDDTLESLKLTVGGTYVDCTVNRAGHSIEIAKAIGPTGTLVCIDLDNVALNEAKENILSLPQAPTTHFIHSNFRNFSSIMETLGISKVDGVLADLGLSSQELDESGRGFTFRFDEPLSMTFDNDPTEETLTAYDIVNTWSEDTLADILYGFADERYARRIAHAIILARSQQAIATTSELVHIIEDAVPVRYRNGKTHCATKTFQALRMAVNDELGAIKDLITSVPPYLLPLGRLSIITFHSTEDRIVKQTLRSLSNVLRIITKKAIVPTVKELSINPRSRSAQLRVAEKI